MYAMPEVHRGPDDDPSLSDDELIAQRKAWFDFYARQSNVFASRGEQKYTCLAVDIAP